MLIFILSIIEAVGVASILFLTFQSNKYAWVGLLIGVVTGLVNWLSPKLTWATVWLGPVFSLVMIGVVAAITMMFYWLHDQGLYGSFKQLFITFLVLIPVTLTAKSAASVTRYAFKANWVMSMPVVISVIALVIMLIDVVMYHD
ncbi:hypothetical protein IJH23_00245 [Candidatus Saccharibacteria bacterium]|nr:hypothetical protein [Candidatus Saccharibacteria bacterium]